MPEEIGDSLVKVGKITFNTEEVLGKGCEGTFVYKYIIFLMHSVYKEIAVYLYIDIFIYKY